MTTHPRILSLCTGYAGLDHAAEEVFGAETVAVSDIDPGANRILAHRYPHIPNLGDLKLIDWDAWAGTEIFTAGYPCQPFSNAGKRAGTDDPRHIFPYIAEGIRRVGPQLVLLENVRGHLRLGFDVVLGTLADIGYDARWVCIRASDVGACHKRERLFIAATPANADGTGLQPVRWVDAFGRDAHGRGRADGPRAAGQSTSLLPTPRTSDANGSGIHGDGGLDLRTAVELLPTPRATRGGSATETFQLLPTPAVNDMGRGKTVEAWDDWTSRMKAAHGNGNGHGPSLEIEALRIGAASGGCETDADEDLRGVRPGVREDSLQRRDGGPGSVHGQAQLLSGLREYEARSAGQHASVAGQEDRSTQGMPGLRSDSEAARSPRRQGRDEQLAGEPDRALRELSPSAALARGSRRADGVDFGRYTAAVERWEQVLGRPAPPPTEVSPRGNHRLSPAFVEFLMGCEPGWVTDPAIWDGMTPSAARNAQLKALGNGVVKPQAAAAMRFLTTPIEVAA